MEKAWAFFEKKMADLKKLALGQDINIYKSDAGQVALADVGLLMLYIQNNSGDIIEETK